MDDDPKYEIMSVSRMPFADICLNQGGVMRLYQFFNNQPKIDESQTKLDEMINEFGT